jgi:signal transduction histidine kinase
VLNNLLSNAIKFTQEGAVTLRLENRPDDAGRRTISFAVDDTGPGMTPDQIVRLFHALRPARPERDAQARRLGPGLVISRDLARLMEGDLTSAAPPAKARPSS